MGNTKNTSSTGPIILFNETPEGIVVARPPKSLDSEGWDLIAFLDAHIKSGRKRFVLDLEGHQSVSSPKVASLILGLRRITDVGGQILVANCCPLVADIFRCLKQDRRFRLDLNLADAIKQAAQR